MALTQDQIDQATRLHGAVAWVYPDVSDTGFWDNFFNGPDFSLTADEQASGISLGPLPAGATPRSRSAARTSAPAASTPLAPVTIGPTQVGDYDYLQSQNMPGISLGTSTGYNANPQQVGTSGTSGNFGNANYQSNLIQALLQAYTPQATNNPGVNMMPNQGGSSPVIDALRNTTPTSGLANNPGVLTMQPYDPNAIFQEIYGRDPTAQELAQTQGMNTNDLRALLTDSYNTWLQGQQSQQGPVQGIPEYDPSYQPGAGLTAGLAGLSSDA